MSQSTNTQMNDNEKLIWAAVYAKHYTGLRNQNPTAIELAWAAVIDLRESRDAVADGWGEEDTNFLFYEQMTEGK